MAKKKKNILKTVASIAIGFVAAPIAGAIGLSGAIGGVVGATAGRVIGGAIVGGALGGVTGTGVVQGALGGGLGGFSNTGNTIPGTGLKIPGTQAVTSTTGAAIKGGVQYAPSVSSSLGTLVQKGGVVGNVPVVAQGTQVAAAAPAGVVKAGLTGTPAQLVANPAAPATNVAKGAVVDPATATSIPKQAVAVDPAKAADIAAQGPVDISAPKTAQPGNVTATGVKGTPDVAAPAMTAEQTAKAALPNLSTPVQQQVVATGVKGTPDVAAPAMTAEQLAKVPLAQNPTQGVTSNLVQNAVKAVPKEVMMQQPVQQAVQQVGLQKPPAAPQKPQVTASSGLTNTIRSLGGAIATNFMTPEGLMAITQAALGMAPTPPGLEEAVAQRQQELQEAQANDVESYNSIRQMAYGMLADINRWDPMRAALGRAATEGTRMNRARREKARQAKAKGYFGGEVAETERKGNIETARAVGEAYNEGWSQERAQNFEGKARVAGLLGTRFPTQDQGAWQQNQENLTDIYTNQQAQRASNIAGLINVASNTANAWRNSQYGPLGGARNKDDKDNVWGAG